MSPLRTLPLIAVLLVLPASPARAVVSAHFRAIWVNDVCAIDGSETIFTGDPDLRFRMAIFDANLVSIFNACGNGCADDGNPLTQDGATSDLCTSVERCGFWDFSDFEMAKVIPNSSGAYFYFGLIDEDDLDADDLLGDHFFQASVTTNPVVYNNNASPYYPAHSLTTVCGGAVEGNGWVNNYALNHSVWFTDSDGPNPIAPPVARDNGVPVTIDNDLRMDFAWSTTSDPHSGISGYAATLWDETADAYLFVNATIPTTGSTSVCSSGCNLIYTPVDGHRYWFRIGATNGNFPGIDNPTTTYSGWAQVRVAPGLVDVEDQPVALALAAPAPNPTAAGASLAYTLPAAGHAHLDVVDLQGRRVAVLADGAAGAGPHRIEWDGRDAGGRRVDSGVYWVRLAFGEARRLQRLVVIR